MANFDPSVVSFDNEQLILVDEDDREIGFESKETCHNGEGMRHRAFSIFIFNENNGLLLQRRSGQKRLWPLFWSNTCCSHPRKGETIERSTLRRLQEEVGLRTDLFFLYKFSYQAAFNDKGSENEVCSVFIGKTARTPNVNSNEIEEWQYIAPETMDREMEENPEYYTPWFKMEWQRIRQDYWEEVEKLKID